MRLHGPSNLLQRAVGAAVVDEYQLAIQAPRNCLHDFVRERSYVPGLVVDRDDHADLS